MSKPVITYNQQEFARVLKEYADGSSKAFTDTYNARMLDVLIKAYRATPKANRSQIIANLNRPVALKGGSEITMAQAIANKNREAQGQPRLHGKELRDAGSRLKGAILKSIGFIRSGWIPGMRTFTAAKNRAKPLAAGRASRAPGARGEPRGRPKGTGKPASGFLSRSVATASNTAQGVEKVGFGPLQTAFAQATAGMKRILERNAEARTKHLNGRVIK